MAACMRCGQVGHLAAQCSQPPTCNNCGGKGCGVHSHPHPCVLARNLVPAPPCSVLTLALGRHLAKACPAIRCDRCGRAGHMARECTKGGNMRCYECGENGHISRDCPVYAPAPPASLPATLCCLPPVQACRLADIPPPCPRSTGCRRHCLGDKSNSVCGMRACSRAARYAYCQRARVAAAQRGGGGLKPVMRGPSWSAAALGAALQSPVHTTACVHACSCTAWFRAVGSW